MCTILYTEAPKTGKKLELEDPIPNKYEFRLLIVMQEKLKNRKYSYIFGATLVLVIVGAFVGGAYVCLSIFFISFLIVLVIQLKNGYALNRQWVLAISHNEHPIQYWVIIALNILGLLCILFFFYLVHTRK